MGRETSTSCTSNSRARASKINVSLAIILLETHWKTLQKETNRLAKELLASYSWLGLIFCLCSNELKLKYQLKGSSFIFSRVSLTLDTLIKKQSWTFWGVKGQKSSELLILLLYLDLIAKVAACMQKENGYNQYLAWKVKASPAQRGSSLPFAR